MHRQDEKFRALDAFEGAIQDREFSDLGAKGRTGSLQDRRYAQREAELLESTALNDMDFKQLGILGFVGALADRFLAFWTAEP